MKVISFNSYKGGACRTTTCYNTLPYLAEQLHATSQQPIIVVDSDLDSMGLTSIFHATEKKAGRGEKLPYSAKHLFVDDAENINSNMYTTRFTDVREDEYFQYFEKVGNKLGLEDNGSVLFLGVDENERTITDDDYAEKETFFESSPAGRLIYALNRMQDETKKPKAIIFDCASGVQLTTLAVFMLIDYSVMCMRPSLQFRIGTRDYLYRMLPGQIKSARKRKERKVILVPTSVAGIAPISDNDADCEALREEFDRLRNDTIMSIRRDIVDFIINESDEVNLGYSLVPKMTELDCFGLPEIERFKWEECLLYKKTQLTTQEQTLKERYGMLASVLVEA